MNRRADRRENAPISHRTGRRRTAAAPARMEEVARAAGVSPVTVSRALNHPQQLAPETLAAVRSAIDRLRYVRNLTAGSLASNRSRIVGAIVPTLASSLFSDTLNGLSEALHDQGYQLLLGQTGYQASEEAALVRAFAGRRVDGIVLAGMARARGVRAALRRAAVPVVETWDLPARPIDMAVGFSNRDAGRAAGWHLVDRGYKRLAFAGGSDDRSQARLLGLIDAAAQRGLSAPLVWHLPNPSTIADGAAAITRLLTDEPELDAVFFSNDMLAAGAAAECARRGWAVPSRVALMGFADLPIAAVFEPALSTVQVRAREIGRCAGDLLLRRLAGAARPAARIVDLGFSVVHRGST